MSHIDEEENTKLLERYHQILKELRIHAREEHCEHYLREFLDQIEFD